MSAALDVQLNGSGCSLTAKRLRRGAFHDVEEPIMAIRRFTSTNTDEAFRRLDEELRQH
jgi:hypothetical protein